MDKTQSNKNKLSRKKLYLGDNEKKTFFLSVICKNIFFSPVAVSNTTSAGIFLIKKKHNKEMEQKKRWQKKACFNFLAYQIEDVLLWQLKHQ